MGGVFAYKCKTKINRSFFCIFSFIIIIIVLFCFVLFFYMVVLFFKFAWLQIEALSFKKKAGM